MTKTTPMCALCKGAAHQRPRRKTTLYKLTCPGENAPEAATTAFLKRLWDCLWVDERFGRSAALNADLMPYLISRKEAWEDRQGLATRPQGVGGHRLTLVADTKERLKAIAPTQPWLSVSTDKAIAAQLGIDHLAEKDLQVDPPHLTVPAKPPIGKWQPLVKLPPEVVGTDSDYLLYLEGES